MKQACWKVWLTWNPFLFFQSIGKNFFNSYCDVKLPWFLLHSDKRSFFYLLMFERFVQFIKHNLPPPPWIKVLRWSGARARNVIQIDIPDMSLAMIYFVNFNPTTFHFWIINPGRAVLSCQHKFQEKIIIPQLRWERLDNGFISSKC